MQHFLGVPVVENLPAIQTQYKVDKQMQSLQFIYFNEFLPCTLKESLSEVLLTSQPKCEAPLIFMLLMILLFGRCMVYAGIKFSHIPPG